MLANPNFVADVEDELEEECTNRPIRNSKIAARYNDLMSSKMTN